MRLDQDRWISYIFVDCFAVITNDTAKSTSIVQIIDQSFQSIKFRRLLIEAK